MGQSASFILALTLWAQSVWESSNLTGISAMNVVAASVVIGSSLLFNLVAFLKAIDPTHERPGPLVGTGASASILILDEEGLLRNGDRPAFVRAHMWYSVAATALRGEIE